MLFELQDAVGSSTFVLLMMLTDIHEFTFPANDSSTICFNCRFSGYLPAKRKSKKFIQRINRRTMKTTVKNTLIALFTFMAIVAVNTVNAAATEDVTPAAELKVIAHFDNQPVFQLSLNNAQNEKFLVVVKDEFGAVVYQETVSGVNIKRKYQLNTEELGTVGLTFEIIGKTNAKPVVFTVENSSRINEETLIVKK